MSTAVIDRRFSLSPLAMKWLMTPFLVGGLHCCACDLDGTVIDRDGDGYAAAESTAVCILPEQIDCDDDDPEIHPGADDVLGDGIDQNCDGVDGDRWADGGTAVLDGGEGDSDAAR